MIEERIGTILRRKKKTLALAESCTGGLVSDRVTDVPGSSGYFAGGIIAYSNEAKISELGVPPGTIKKYGAVSREVAKAMAEGAKWVFSADLAASITGIAGPTGGTKNKPVGLAYIAFCSKKKCRTRKVLFKGDRRTLKEKFAEAVLKLMEDNA